MRLRRWEAGDTYDGIPLSRTSKHLTRRAAERRAARNNRRLAYRPGFRYSARPRRPKEIESIR
jgi:hypothetical protein